MMTKWLPLSFCCLLGLAGCKKQVQQPQPGTTSAPLGGAIAVSPDPEPGAAAVAVTASAEPQVDETQKALHNLGAPLFPGERPDAGQIRPDSTFEERKARWEEEQKKAQQEAQARVAAQTAVTSALNGVKGQLKECYEKETKESGTVGITVRLSPAGNVLSSEVTGVNPQGQDCMKQILGGLRFSGLTISESMTLTRQLQLRAYE